MKVRMKSLLSRLLIIIFYPALVIFFPTFGYPLSEVDNYPTRPVTLIIHLAPGGPTDLATRLIAKEATKFLGQPIVLLNKPGGSMAIGTAAIAAAKPDGYTIGLSLRSPMLIVPRVVKVPYHPLKDFRQIIQFASFNFGVFVKYDSPFRDFKDLVAFARQNPKKLTWAGQANTMQHYIMAKIAQKEKVEFTLMPFKGTSEMEMSLLGGHTLAAAGNFNYSLLEAKRTRLLLLFEEERPAEFSDTPNLKDLGYDIPNPQFLAIQGPKNLPEGIVRKLEQAFSRAMKEPGFIQGMKTLHLPIVHRSSKDMKAYLTNGYEARKNP